MGESTVYRQVILALSDKRDGHMCIVLPNGKKLHSMSGEYGAVHGPLQKKLQQERTVKIDSKEIHLAMDHMPGFRVVVEALIAAVREATGDETIELYDCHILWQSYDGSGATLFSIHFDNHDMDNKEEAEEKKKAILNVSDKDSPYALIDKYFPERESYFYQNRKKFLHEFRDSGGAGSDIGGLDPSEVRK